MWSLFVRGSYFPYNSRCLNDICYLNLVLYPLLEIKCIYLFFNSWKKMRTTLKQIWRSLSWRSKRRLQTGNTAFQDLFIVLNKRNCFHFPHFWSAQTRCMRVKWYLAFFGFKYNKDINITCTIKFAIAFKSSILFICRVL